MSLCMFSSSDANSRLSPFVGNFPSELSWHVLSFCDWKSRANVRELCSVVHIADDREGFLWKWFCERLSSENDLYIPLTCAGNNGSWRNVFIELYKKRKIWQPSSNVTAATGTVVVNNNNNDNDNDGEYAITTCVRFKPANSSSSKLSSIGESSASSKKDVLPLHQRLQVLQARHGCCSSEAKRLLWNSTSNCSSSGSSSGSSNSCFTETSDPYSHVYIEDDDEAQKAKQKKCKKEDGSNDFVADQFMNSFASQAIGGVVSIQPQNVIICAPGVGLREFAFNKVFESSTPQTVVYDTIVSRMTADLLNGCSGSILCYGQTGSGKTYTMFGKDENHFSIKSLTSFSGLVPRMCSEVMFALKDINRNHINKSVTLSYVEVYGDEVTDLLRDGEIIGAWSGVAVRAVLSGSASVSVESIDHLERLLEAGNNAKRKAATAMNERSSRAHAVFILSLTQHNTKSDIKISSQLCLADLGGSEQLKKSNATDARMEEAVKINLGLLALHKCIRCLNEGRGCHVPFWDSKLTMILSAALGGKCRTAVIVNASMDPQYSSETLQALRFGEECSQIQTSSKNDGVSIVSSALAALDRDIAQCQEEIKAAERWETVQVSRPDVVEGKCEGWETTLKTTLVGAEEEHARLEALIEQRKNLLSL